MKALIIGHTIPEPATTAAGQRMMQLISIFTELEYEIIFASTAQKTPYSEDLSRLGIETASIALNDSTFDSQLTEWSPDIVLFDRYITEEQFGWRVAEQCPNAIRVLDTEDLHFLRKAREEAVMKEVPLDLFTGIAKREMASILRSDLSLIISEYEMSLLMEKFNIPQSILLYLPFVVNPISSEQIRSLPSFDQRAGFVTMGNFQHRPNKDGVRFLKTEIWPKIREKLPEAELSIYGAYASRESADLHDVREGFLLKGWVDSVAEVLQTARVCLAPLRFGAGLKGKILDAMAYGTPSVTTSIGAEGMFGGMSVPGHVADDAELFAKAAVDLFQNKDQWYNRQKNGFRILEERFSRNLVMPQFVAKVAYLTDNIKLHREHHFLGQILQHQSLQATRYMSKWIEEKNKKKS